MSQTNTNGLPTAGAALRIILVGTYFGIVLAKSEVARWERVHKMFLFEQAQMYLIIGVGIGVAMIAMFLLKKMKARAIDRTPIIYKPKPYHKGIIFGGMIFGAGWAITGACPGPIYTQIGGGEAYAVFTLVGAILGMFSYAYFKPKLPH